jgi:hypothetical protein
VDKAQIVRLIKRIADESGGVPPGARRFMAEAGVKEKQWRGSYWARWGDALQEAGFAPNRPAERYGEELLAERTISLCRRLGRFPTWAELTMEKRADDTFPSFGAFRRARLGTMPALATKITEYCEQRDGYEDVLRYTRSIAGPATAATTGDGPREGSVYLIKAGRHYKIGRAFDLGRRGREIALQLPERAVVVHVIKTDDPIGIEAYWHRRFESKRKNGEWFELAESDVRAFKRRKSFM